MADRTYNAVDTRVLDEDWSALAITVFINLIVMCPNQYGVWILGLGRLKRHWRELAENLGADRDQLDVKIAQALDELKMHGVIRMTDRNRIWVVGKWGREKGRQLGNNRLAAISHVCMLAPEFADEFSAMYPVDGDWWKTPGSTTDGATDGSSDGRTGSESGSAKSNPDRAQAARSRKKPRKVVQ